MHWEQAVMIDSIKLERLKEYFETRVKSLHDARHSGQREEIPRETLVSNLLRLMERTLTDALGAHHFELSVWVNPTTPWIMAYYDSSAHTRPRSDSQRAQDPNYYRSRKYEVINILDNPTPEIFFLDRPTNTNYHFVGVEQEHKIKSTFLYCFDLARPTVIVVTADKPGALSRQVIPEDLIRTIGLAVRAEMAVDDSRQPSSFAYSWIHVSDIHFGAGSQKHRFDQRKVCAAILRDVERRSPTTADSIFVTGDIAFSAEVSQYNAAAAWLQDLAAKAGVSNENVYLVPGNHDIDRKSAAEAAVASCHDQARRSASALDELLESEPARTLLLKKLAAYQKFVHTNFPTHPRWDTDWSGDWHRRIERAQHGYKLNIRLVGLSTVWVSDAHDGESSDGSFLPNMVLAQGQLEGLLGATDGDDLILLLSHHPPDWLQESSRTMLQRFLARPKHVHLCGHTHNKGARMLHLFGQHQAMRFIAGAVHNEEPKQRGAQLGCYAEHGYGIGAIRWNSGWEVGWGPRVYVPELDTMRIDRTHYDLDEQGFSWKPLNRG